MRSLLLTLALAPAAVAADDYAVVFPARLKTDPGWSVVAQALVEKHDGRLVEYGDSLDSAAAALSNQLPRFACFVEEPVRVTREFVKEVQQLTRGLDDDPYTDCIWGILTGFDASNALRTARHKEPLLVRKAASGTEIALDCLVEGKWYDELKQNKSVVKEPGGTPREERVPQDTTALLVASLNEYRPDLFVTSGHATERAWQLGYRYNNGSFLSKAGRLYGRDLEGKELDVDSPNPKVYLPVGNCLMGHIDGPDAMALAWMRSAGVMQMAGYTQPTWYGYAGWGLLDYFVEQPGRYTLAEAYFANSQALLHRLETEELSDSDRRGLEFDLDVVPFYGDPAWSARLADGPLAYDQALVQDGDTHTFTVTPRRGEKSFDPINRNGSQRGGRPFVALLPRRIGKAEVTEGADLRPLITDNFILVPRPAVCDTSRAYRVRFTAAIL